MLRRRRKSPKPDKHATHAAHGAHGAAGSRRRARPDTPVPAELMLPEGGLEAAPPPAAKARRARERPPPQPASLPPPAEPAQLEGEAIAQREPAPQPEREPHRTRAPQPDRAPQPERAPQPQRPREPERRREVRAPAPGGTVLVTGFECFGGERINPSWEICNRLPRMLAGYRVETVHVPCEFRRAIEVVADAIERYAPSLVLCLGQAGGRTHVSVERVAINVDDAAIADNAGAQPVDEPVAVNGPPAYFATLPVKAMAAAMRAAGVPAEVSNTAGTYVCNHLMYGVLHFLARSGIEARAGFVHVPYAEEQVLDKPGKPSLAIAAMARGVEAALAAALALEADIGTVEGKLD